MEDHFDNEAILWNKLKKGDTDSLGHLYDLFIDDLFTYGIQFSQDKNYVKDCIHDLFLDLYKYRKKLADTDNVKYYLLRSLKNKILKKSKKVILSVEHNSSYQKIDSKNYSKSYEEEIIAQDSLDERSLKLSLAMKFLSKKQKRGLFLRFNEEKNYEEVAEIMNVSIETSRTLVYRAIKTLRKHLTVIIAIQNIF